MSAGGRGSEPGLRHWLKRVPGLRPAYRAARAAGWWVKDTARDWRWLLRARFAARGVLRGRTETVWAEEAGKRARVQAGEATQWLDSPEVLNRYVFPQFGGKHWYDYVAERYCGEPRALGLSLCCGDGDLERNLLRHGVCRSCEGVDISAGAIEIARREADAAGLSDRLKYRVGDVERMRLERGRYDVIAGWMALHHLRRLPRVLAEVRGALRPGGIFIVNEYVGPARFQVRPKQVALVNEMLGGLPEELRRLPGGGVKERFDRPRLEEIIRHDPSEAVCSHRIMPLVRRNFVVVECVEYGGTVLNWLLGGIVQNFRPDDPGHRKWLDWLYGAEREALASGEFGSDFAFVIAQRPEDGAPQ